MDEVGRGPRGNMPTSAARACACESQRAKRAQLGTEEQEEVACWCRKHSFVAAFMKIYKELLPHASMLLLGE